jgi:hypothetical protein
MGGLWNIMIGYFFGFALGVGCALAVMYTIWTGGYKRAVEHSLMPEPPARFQAVRQAALRKQSNAPQR